jgi:hypothetical protein
MIWSSLPEIEVSPSGTESTTTWKAFMHAQICPQAPTNQNRQFTRPEITLGGKIGLVVSWLSFAIW